jgi:flagellar biosynthesis/type III secretory pathway protein FliH
VIFRRDRFGDLIRRQLDLFAADEADLLRESEEAEHVYDAADREDAEEAYGDYQLVLEAIADQLEELRDTYASTLDAEAAEAYAQAFARAARKRFPKLRAEL